MSQRTWAAEGVWRSGFRSGCGRGAREGHQYHVTQAGCQHRASATRPYEHRLSDERMRGADDHEIWCRVECKYTAWRHGGGVRTDFVHFGVHTLTDGEQVQVHVCCVALSDPPLRRRGYAVRNVHL